MNINDLSKIAQDHLTLLVDGSLERSHAKEIFNGIGKVLNCEMSKIKYDHHMNIKRTREFFEPTETKE